MFERQIKERALCDVDLSIQAAFNGPLRDGNSHCGSLVAATGVSLDIHRKLIQQQDECKAAFWLIFPFLEFTLRRRFNRLREMSSDGFVRFLIATKPKIVALV